MKRFFRGATADEQAHCCCYIWTSPAPNLATRCFNRFVGRLPSSWSMETCWQGRPRIYHFLVRRPYETGTKQVKEGAGIPFNKCRSPGSVVGQKLARCVISGGLIEYSWSNSAKASSTRLHADEEEDKYCRTILDPKNAAWVVMQRHSTRQNVVWNKQKQTTFDGTSAVQGHEIVVPFKKKTRKLCQKFNAFCNFRHTQGYFNHLQERYNCNVRTCEL